MQENPEIIFLFPNYKNGDLDYHLGANYIIASLRKQGIRCEQFVNSQFIGLPELIERILAASSPAVGITCYDSNYLLVKLFSQLIKKRSPDTLIIAGGPTATFSDRAIMRDTPEIDICVRGEGEYATLEILQQIKGNRDFSVVSGISFRKDNKILQNPDRPLIKDARNKDAELDIIPSPYLTGIIKPADIIGTGQEISILTSRGCVYNCSYCNFSAMSRHTIRYHSVERVISELKVIQKSISGLYSSPVNIYDDAFTLNRKRTQEICRRIIREGIKLNFWAETRADYADKGLLELLFQAGVRELNFGLESAVPRVLYNVKKVRLAYEEKQNLSPEKEFVRKIQENVKLAKKIGFKTSVSVIFGLPGETFKGSLKTLKFIRDLKVDLYYHNLLNVFSGTELAGRYKRSHPGLFKKNLLTFRGPSNYNLNRIPQLKHSYGIKEKNFASQSLLLSLNFSLLGLYRTKPRYGRPQDIILLNTKPSLKWLKNFAALQTRIFELKNLKRPAGYAMRYFNLAVKHLFKKHIYLYLIKNFYPAKQKMHPKKTLRLIDRCRWGLDCPGIRLERIFIRGQNILPCLEAKPIGKTQDKLETLRKRMNLLLEKEKLKRGCSACPVRNICAKCIFLGTLNPKDYCRVKKRYGHKISKSIGDLELNEIISLKKALEGQLPFL